MKRQSLPLPGLRLTSAQWRCLRVLSEVGDIAHAARKLHWSQAVLKAALAELHERMGAQHIALADERVQLSPTLKNLICQQPLCGQQGALAGAPDPAGGSLPCS
ncbi:MAG: LysR family transcriptional regulator [Polaromonas sp.]